MSDQQPKRCPGRGRAEAYILIGLVLVLGFGLTRLSHTAEMVREDTLRLHVVANSDTIRDQQTKLKARDAVLDTIGPLLAGATGRDEAAALVRENAVALESAVSQAIGDSQSVRVRLTRQHFPTTRYEGFTLPEGEYQALRVELGEGKGHNWFCVLYPGLCISGAEGKYAEPAENALVFGRHEIRFALLEWMEKWKKVD